MFNPLPSEEEFDAASVTLNPAPMGMAYGFHAGWNMPHGRWIFGVEGDYSWTGIDGDVDLNPVPAFGGGTFNSTYTVVQQIDWMASIRARAGIVRNDKYLIYGTGGVAFAKIGTNATANYFPEGNVIYGSGLQGTRTGFTFGGGIEGSITERLGWRAEFLHFGFGTETFVANPIPNNPPFQMEFVSKNDSNIFRGAINYRF
jgi:outer membrane immunogenic protein